MNKKIFQALIFSLVAVFSIQNISFAVWTGPTFTPPLQNLPPPLNLSSTEQTKSGTLILGGNPNALLIPVGFVGIGTTAPSEKLSVENSNTVALKLNLTNFSNSSLVMRLLNNDTDNFNLGLGGENFLQYDGPLGIRTTTLGMSAGKTIIQGSVGIGGSSIDTTYNITTNTNKGGIKAENTTDATPAGFFRNTFTGGPAIVAMGNVGIGTTNPVSKLQIKYSGDSASINTDDYALKIGNSGYNIANPYTGIKFESPGVPNSPSEYSVPAYIRVEPSSVSAAYRGNMRFLVMGDNTYGGGFSFENIGVGATPAGTVMTIKATGNVGIGTTGPNKKVEVAESIATTLRLTSTRNDSTWVDNDQYGALEFYGSDASGIGAGVKAAIRVYESGGGIYGGPANMSFSVSGSANDQVAMTILQNGNVGIGATNPTSKLHVAGSVAGNVDLTIGDPSIQAAGTLSWWNITRRGDNYFGAGTRGLTIWGDANASYVAPILLQANGNVILAGAIGSGTTNGNVGIGTTAPGSLLTAAGTVQVTGLGAWPTSAQGLELAYNSGDTTSYVQSYNRAGSAFLPLKLNALNIQFANSGTEAMRITGGNVGIGTTNPGVKLEIESTSPDPAVIIDGNIANTSWVTQHYFRQGTVKVSTGLISSGSFGGAFTNGFGVSTYDGSWHEMLAVANDGSKITMNGNVGIGTTSPGEKLEVNGNVKATAFYYSSDASLKKDIKPIDNALSNIQQLNGVSFKWKENGEQGVGLVAQNVEQVYPELVKTDANTGLKSVQYGNLVAPLIEAVKEQQKQIDELKIENEILKNRLDILEDK